MLKVGQSAVCVSTLRPFGSVEIEGQRYEAKAEEGWIDEGSQVFVLGVHGRNVLVGSRNPLDREQDQPAEEVFIDLDPPECSAHQIPVHGPEFWLEWNQLWILGAGLGAVATGILYFRQPLTAKEFLVLPSAGAAIGFVLQFFIRGARDLAGPHTDHRPYAYLQILVMFLGLAFGGFVGLGVDASVVSLAVGMFLGCLAGGLLSVLIHAIV
jgi:hypothetical protein